MNSDLISVIVPIYKVEKYLKECVDSICNQTYSNLEIILVDDGSPDKCGQICDDYEKKDNRIKVIHKKNGGLSSARNAGLDIARGEFISFIDSDDCIAYDFIEKLHTLCIENNADIAECDFVSFQDGTKMTKDNVNIRIDIFSSKEKQIKMYIEDYVKSIIACNKLYKKYIYNNLRFPVGKINEDEFCTYKALYSCKNKIVVTNEQLYYYRYNPESIMGKKFNLKRLDGLEALVERKNFYKNHNEEELYIKTSEKYGEIIRYIYGLVKENIDNSQEILKKLHNDAKENYKEIKKYKDIKLGSKFKNMMFITCPNIYLSTRKISFLRKIAKVPEL